MENNVSTTVARRLQVTVQVPWYLNQAGPGSSVRLVLGKDGLPVYQGLQPVNYTILVPHSLVNNGTTVGCRGGGVCDECSRVCVLLRFRVECCSMAMACLVAAQR